MNMRKSMKILSVGLLLSIPFATHPMELPDLSQAKKPVASWVWNKWNNVPSWKTIKETVSAATNAVVSAPQAIKTVATHAPSLADMAQATKGYVQNSPFIQEQAQNAVVALSKAGDIMPSNPTLKKAGAVGALAATGYVAHKAYQWINAENNTALPSFETFQEDRRAEPIGMAGQLNAQDMPVAQLPLPKEYQVEPVVTIDTMSRDEEVKPVSLLKDYQANDIIDSEDTQLVVEPVVTHAVSSQKVILMPKTKPAPPRPKTPNTQPKYSLSQITQEEVETVTIPAAAIAMPQQNQVEPTAELPVCKDLLCKGNKLSLVEAAVIEKFAEQPKEIINTKLSIVEEPIVHQLELVKEDGLYALYDALCILDNDGNTALHRAVIAGSEQKVREILNPFAGIRNDLAARLIHEIKNKAGLSAAQLANEIDNFDILLVITTYL